MAAESRSVLRLPARWRRAPACTLVVRPDAQADSPHELVYLDAAQFGADLAARLAAGSRRAVRIEVATAYARLWLMPWSAPLDSERRWALFASARATQLYGEASAGWTVQIGWELPPHARLAVALPTPLVDGARQALGRRLASLTVPVIGRLQRLLRREPRFTGWLLEFCPAGVWLLALLRGHLQRVRLRRIECDPQADPLALVAQLGPVLRAEWAALAPDVERPAVAMAGGIAQLPCASALAAVGSGRCVLLD